MAPFFDQPGSQAGPYSTPARQGILSRILQGVTVATKLGDFYQNWQTKSQAQKTGALEGVAKQIGLAQKISPDQPVVPSAEMVSQAEKGGFPWPKTTEETRTGMAAKLMPAPVASTPGDNVTSPTDPAQVARSAAQTQGMANLPAVGSPMAIQPAPKSLEDMLVRKMAGGQSGDLSQAIGMYNQIKHPGAASTADYHKEMLKLKEREVGVKEREKPDNWKEKADYKHKLDSTDPNKQNFKVGADGKISAMGKGKFHYEPKPKDDLENETIKENIGTYAKPIWRTTKSKKGAAGSAASQPTALPDKFGGGKGKEGKYFTAEDGSNYQWDGSKYVPYTGE